jgi:hypothetical protein
LLLHERKQSSPLAIASCPVSPEAKGNTGSQSIILISVGGESEGRSTSGNAKQKIAMTIEYQCVQLDAVVPRRGMEYVMLHKKSFEQD